MTLFIVVAIASGILVYQFATWPTEADRLARLTQDLRHRMWWLLAVGRRG